jgi:uncharacterized protein
MSKIFLEAEWRKLVIANYAVNQTLLKPFLPNKTEIDLWNNTCYISLVGFMFLNTKIKGIKIPFHTTFEEVNLRFYVRYHDNSEWKRGVVFIKEIVPKPALTFVANTVYHENYETMPMRHVWEITNESINIKYQWRKKGWNSISISTEKTPIKIEKGSEEEFITEHYWGYTKITENKTSEYHVEHPIWNVYKTKDYHIDVDFEAVYGAAFNFLKAEKPKSVFLAEGSEIKVMTGIML